MTGKTVFLWQVASWVVSATSIVVIIALLAVNHARIAGIEDKINAVLSGIGHPVPIEGQSPVRGCGCHAVITPKDSVFNDTVVGQQSI